MTTEIVDGVSALTCETEPPDLVCAVSIAEDDLETGGCTTSGVVFAPGVSGIACFSVLPRSVANEANEA